MINRVQDFYNVQFRVPENDPQRPPRPWTGATQRLERLIVEQPGRSLIAAFILGMVTACLIKRR